MSRNRIIIGTRGSKLALAQARWVADRLTTAWPGLNVELSVIKTQGDKILDVPLAKVGGKGLFVKEIEDALLGGRVDLAVHSMKDVPAATPEGLTIAVIPPREDPRDTLVAPGGHNLDTLPAGARIGTSSLRRQAQILHHRPDLQVLTLRGNLDTRLGKLADGQYDAIVVAAAGLARLGLAPEGMHLISPGAMLPAVGQGALGLECREDDGEMLKWLDPLHHRPTAVCVAAERAFLKTLEGGCQVPLAAMAVETPAGVQLTGLIAGLDGHPFIREVVESCTEDAERKGVELANHLLERGGRKILAEVYAAAAAEQAS